MDGAGRTRLFLFFVRFRTKFVCAADKNFCIYVVLQHKTKMWVIAKKLLPFKIAP